MSAEFKPLEPFVVVFSVSLTDVFCCCFLAIIQGAVPPHGPIAHPASQRSTRPSMYHGGEVQPDNDMVEDVVDSPADGNDADASGVSDDDEKVVGLEECPRCLRKFDGEDSNAILKHIERCIS